MRASTYVYGALVSCLAIALSAPAAYSIGDKHDNGPVTPPAGPSGDASASTLTASVGTSSIKVTQVGGGPGSNAPKALAPVDPNWKPPACWYEPVATPEQLKAAVDQLKKGGDMVQVTPSLSWGEDLMVNSYEKGKPSGPGEASYKNFNLGKDGMFWRGVMNKDMESDMASYSCERTLFWQAANTVPKDSHAPTPEVLASYAYDRIKVPDTKIELKPAAQSTVNLPTWVWSEKGRFKDVKVRAELPHTNLWAETTAKPVSLHLEAGTPDAETYPASGECPINDDGSIGAPYSKGDADKTPPCGITYLRATNGKAYQLKASVTWQISWTGSGGANGDLPDGAFESTQDMNVQEIQSVNR
ncbi:MULTISPECIES: hypothetical protein [unclassified Streptomyces]|uniref:hypothetical protein n=1 Tax=unclassified Streptomyces TaxID=2593676 RepID=UPI002E1D7A1D